MSDVLSVIALIISVVSIVLSFQISLFAKQLDIEYSKFDLLIIDVIKEKLKVVEALFENHSNDISSLHLTTITDVYVDIVLFLIESKDQYQSINPDTVQDECSEFTDYLYQNQIEQISEFRNRFLAHKSRLLGLIYNQAKIESEIALKAFFKKFWD